MVQEGANHPLHVSHARFRGFRKPFSVVDAENLHTPVILQAREQFRRDEEVLSTLSLAGYLHKLTVYGPLIVLIHTLGARNVRNRRWREAGLIHT